MTHTPVRARHITCHARILFHVEHKDKSLRPRQGEALQPPHVETQNIASPRACSRTLMYIALVVWEPLRSSGIADRQRS